MLGYNGIHQQVAPLAAIHSRLAAAGHAHALAIVNSGGNPHLKLLANRLIACSVAVRAPLLDDLACAVTVRAGLNILYLSKQGLLRIHDLPLAIALGAGLRRRARLCARAVAAGAGLLKVDLYLLLAAEYRLLKADAHRGTQIRAAGRAASCPGGASAAKDIAENIAENVAHIPAEVKTAKPAEAPGSGAAALLKGRVSELVVLLALLGITEDAVGLGSLLELGLRLLVTRIGVRVVLLGKLSVCFFQRVLVRVPGDAQDLVIISLALCHLTTSILLNAFRTPKSRFRLSLS